ncbi:MAG: large subunit ribosomal protein [Clostridiales bacterium]|nr:large subunit ribosomal protein [Clostridiales bacterium]MDN5281760.1 large subunit ribosomal protein [Candidatus Ozemobacter sp.]
MKTFQPKKSDFTREWVIVDAKDMSLGRLASQVAARLRGKHRPFFAPHLDCGDFVVIVNADKIRLTGNKYEDKVHYWHTGYPGGIKSVTYGQLLDNRPDKMVWLAVKRMLPRNKLRKRFLRKLKVYGGAEHPHTAQQPKTIKLVK